MGKKLVIIAGPTAVGKTELAIWLAKKFSTVVVSADSRQIYKEMQIGTARPTEEEMQGVKHFYIANKSVEQYYNAYKYEVEALELLNRLFKQYNPIIMVGGSGLYIDAIVKGIDDIPTVLPQIRQQLMQWYQEAGKEKLQQLLYRLDPEYYRRVDLNNQMRLLKALEITIQAARPYSSFLKGKNKQRDFDIILIGLNRPREELYQRINKRVDKMIQSGLIDEVKRLYPLKHLTALRTVGYQELFQYLDGKITLDEAIDLIKRNTRKYARRQLTWFRRYDNIKWFEPQQKEQIFSYIKEKLNE